ncbi:DNA mismatch repair endonuclease MutL [Candidatus Karelsulcia muelleri]|uniref:DNA mismatch repair protein MutL n=1 Tax=Candidatus Karelsulcia muelleri PSPU TaxID=1189303 RepID=A0AAD1EXJ9_9FLAO|nr:DNA mismatch repair endonuclease MutL [Candidatus Karelsulcia muelleri]NJJ98764.1 DNA mismatch repair protein MutL [Candidatus Karelsulcia muelleri]BAO66416.1 DNA mismatch repair protein MutL [Candidatus Karelsulcia muelleri PSPU]
MTDVIKLLSKNVSNKIASGDVIHNPSSILKEILENSIDAYAKNIKIILLNGGKDRIHIIDDGIGMSKNDAIKSFERYSTSKINKVEDLLNLSTKGFRGEALSYITSVTQIEIDTRYIESDIGIRLIIENGKLKYKPLPISMDKGCSICIKNIFYNIPVKRKFLKSSNLELKNIINEFYKIVLSHNDINFILKNNKKIVFFLKKSSHKKRIIKIFGKKIKKYLIKIKKTTNLVKIQGYITNTKYFNLKKQYIFLNKRFIKNKNLHNAIINSYEGLTKKKYNPSYFIFLTMDPSKFNINISPYKTKVKFYDEIYLCNKISTLIKEYLGINNIKKFFLKKKDTDKNYIFFFNKKYKNIKESLKEKKFNSNFFLENVNKYYLYKWIQIYNKYLLGFIKFELILVNQNRAHQRILYDFFYYKKYKKKKKIRFPIEIKIINKNYSSIKEIINKLNYLGFEINLIKDIILVKYIPLMLESYNISNFIKSIISNFDLNLEIFYKKICKYFSIKNGVKINNLKIKYLIKNLFNSNNPYYTPFGKKIIFNFTKN